MEYNENITSAEEITDVEEIKTEVTESVDLSVMEFANWEIKVVFNPALASVKLTDVSKEDKINLIKLKIELGKVATSVQEYEKTVVESLKDAKFTAIEEASKGESASQEDKKAYEDAMKTLEKDANEICVEKYNETVKISCDKLSESAFYTIADTFDLAALGGYDYIYNKLVKQK